MKRLLLWILILGLIGGGGYYAYGRFFAPKSLPTISRGYTVGSGSIKNIVKATGKVYPIQESNLSFTKQGVVGALYKKEGDTVKAGELIAELDAKGPKLDVENAKVSLSNAQNNLDKINKGATEVERIKALNAVTEAEAKLVSLQNDYQDLLNTQKTDITNNENTITLLKEKVEVASGELDYAQKNIPTDSRSDSLIEDTTNGYKIIETAYQSIAPGLKTVNDTLLSTLQSASTYDVAGENYQALKVQMQSLYSSTQERKTTFDSTIITIRNKKDSFTNIITGLGDIQTLVSDLSRLTTLSVSLLRASKTGSNNPDPLVETKITTLQSLSDALTTTSTNITNTLTILKNYENNNIQDLAESNTIKNKKAALNSAKTDLDKAERALKDLKKTYESKIAVAKQNIELQNNTIKLNKASYTDTINGPESTDLVSARNSVKSAQISLQKAIITLSDYQLYAAFDGKVRDIPWTVGDTTKDTESISIENSGGYEIKVSLDQADVVKIKTGMEARVSLDAYANTSWTGTVSSVSSTPTETSNVVSYTAVIRLPKTEKEVFPSMSATVQIIVAEKSGVLIIPTSSIKTEGGKTYVEILSGNNTSTTTKIEVALGAADDVNTEVLSGISLGQKIRLQSVTRSSGSGSTSSSSLFGGSSSRSSSSSFSAGGPPPF